jgi:NADH-quinone oxidoreductase subunit G
MAAPGTEPEVLDALADNDDEVRESAAALRRAGAVVVVGERLATVPGALTAALRLAETTGARLAWIPRRAGERGAVEAGLLPGLLPGGRPVADASARVDLSTVWGGASLPTRPGRDASAILAAVHTGDVRALVVGGVDPDDLPDPLAVRAAIDAAGFVVSLEQRPSAVTERADVVLPVAAVAEKTGTFLDWEGRVRPFDTALPGVDRMPDTRVLHVLADAMGVDLGLPDVTVARREIDEVGRWEGDRAAAPAARATEPTAPGAGEAVLSTWHLLLDGGRLQDGEPYLAGTAHAPVARLSAGTADEVGVADGEAVTVATDAGAITLPLAVTDMPDRVVWLPTRSTGSAVRATLGAGSGSPVRLSAGGAQ